MGDVRVTSREAWTKSKPAEKAEKENRTSRIFIRFTRTEYASVKNEARISGLTVVAFARERIFSQRVASKADQSGCIVANTLLSKANAVAPMRYEQLLT
jgi:hypothetical protein